MVKSGLIVRHAWWRRFAGRNAPHAHLQRQVAPLHSTECLGRDLCGGYAPDLFLSQVVASTGSSETHLTSENRLQSWRFRYCSFSQILNNLTLDHHFTQISGHPGLGVWAKGSRWGIIVNLDSRWGRDGTEMGSRWDRDGIGMGSRLDLRLSSQSCFHSVPRHADHGDEKLTFYFSMLFFSPLPTSPLQYAGCTLSSLCSAFYVTTSARFCT